MNGTNDASGTANERLDQLLSLRQDGALDARETAELEGLLSESRAASEAARERARAFAEVDESLRRLAARTIPAARLERSLAAVERRVGVAGSQRSPHAGRLARRYRIGFGLGIAAAAAALWLVLVLLPRGEGPALRTAGDRARPTDAAMPAVVSHEHAVAANDEVATEASAESGASNETAPTDATEVSEADPAAEDLASLGIEEASDLEVIDELELLDFLATRNPPAEGPRG